MACFFIQLMHPFPYLITAFHHKHPFTYAYLLQHHFFTTAPRLQLPRKQNRCSAKTDCVFPAE